MTLNAENLALWRLQIKHFLMTFEIWIIGIAFHDDDFSFLLNYIIYVPFLVLQHKMLSHHGSCEVLIFFLLQLQQILFIMVWITVSLVF